MVLMVIFQLENFAFHVHGESCATGRRARPLWSLRRYADLSGQIAAIEFTLSVKSFQVPATPGTWPDREAAFGADFARHARHLTGEAVS